MPRRGGPLRIRKGGGPEQPLQLAQPVGRPALGNESLRQAVTAATPRAPGRPYGRESLDSGPRRQGARPADSRLLASSTTSRSAAELFDYSAGWTNAHQSHRRRARRPRNPEGATRATEPVGGGTGGREPLALRPLGAFAGGSCVVAGAADGAALVISTRFVIGGDGASASTGPSRRRETSEVPDDLVSAAVSGDRAAVARLLATIRPLVVRYCRGRLGSVDRTFLSADDVDQEVCLAVLTALPSYQPQGRPFLAFVYRVAANQLVDAYRVVSRARSEPVAEVPDAITSAAGPEQQALQGELSASPCPAQGAFGQAAADPCPARGRGSVRGGDRGDRGRNSRRGAARPASGVDADAQDRRPPGSGRPTAQGQQPSEQPSWMTDEAMGAARTRGPARVRVKRGSRPVAIAGTRGRIGSRERSAGLHPGAADFGRAVRLADRDDRGALGVAVGDDRAEVAVGVLYRAG